MALGFSHPVEVEIPKGLTVTADKNIISISGADKQQVGQFAAEVRELDDALALVVMAKDDRALAETLLRVPRALRDRLGDILVS